MTTVGGSPRAARAPSSEPPEVVSSSPQTIPRGTRICRTCWGVIATIGWLAIVAGRPATHQAAHTRLRVFEVIEFVGRWSMIDVFVVAILSALVQLGFVASIHPGPAAVCFALSVAFTMLSAQSFDPRLIWRGLPLRDRKDRTTG